MTNESLLDLTYFCQAGAMRNRNLRHDGIMIFHMVINPHIHKTSADILPPYNETTTGAFGKLAIHNKISKSAFGMDR